MEAWTGGVQSVLQSFGVNMTALTEANIASNTTFASSPLESLRAAAGVNDLSSLMARILQFGALGGMFQLFYVTDWLRWIYYCIYDYTLSRFILTMHFDGDEMPYMYVS